MSWKDWIDTAQWGKCEELMPRLPDECVHGIITDPPYGLKFMGKEWDKGVPSVPFWREALRVAMPGAYLLAFGGTRTFHRLMCAIEDAGWEIRDTIMWVYGSGFPKSHDVSKAIDKRGGTQVAWFGPWFRKWREENSITQKQVAALFPSKTGGLTGCVANWELGFNMPTPEQFNLIRDTFGLPFDSIEEAEREVVGEKSSGLSGGTGCTVGRFTDSRNERGMVDITAPATEAAKQWQGWGTALKPAWEPIIVARKPLEGTVAENVLKYGTGAMNIDGCRVLVDSSVDDPRLGGKGTWASDKMAKNVYGDYAGGRTGSSPAGRWPANLIHDDSEEVVRGFPVTQRSKGKYVRKTGDVQFLGMMGNGSTNVPDGLCDSGSAARFFYCAKASKAERGKDNRHPTVKPLKLMEYLIKLVSRDDQIILDMFAGSGGTLVACKKLGRRFMGFEINEEDVLTCNKRLKCAQRLNQEVFVMEN